MLDLPSAHGFLEGMRVARVAGDVDATAAIFAPDASFTIVGFAPPVHGREAIHAAIASMIDLFEFLEWRPIETFVKENEIAVRHALRVRYRPTGKIGETETADFLTMKDGLCSSFTQYADTALIAEMMKG